MRLQQVAKIRNRAIFFSFLYNNNNNNNKNKIIIIIIIKFFLKDQIFFIFKE